MLVNSNVVKGKCPICGVASCACGGPSKVVAVDENVTKAERGPLQSYPLGRGVSIQLTEEAARARGLLPPLPPKKAEPTLNKKRPAAPNKARR